MPPSRPLLLLLSISLVVVGGCSEPLSQTVQTDTGPVRGGTESMDSSVLVFKGIPYVFDTLDAVERPWEFVDRRLADQMSSMWVNFAETGDQNGAGLASWPTYDAATRPVLEIGDTLRTRMVLDEAVVDFFDQELDAR